MQLSEEQKSALNRVGRQFTDLGGQDFATFVQEQILDPIEKAAAGITAAAEAVNAIALSNVVAVRDKGTAPGTSLVFAWKTFRFHNGKSLVTVPAGNLTLAASSTNYVEVSRSGTVSSNTTGFTSGRMPLWEVVTSSGTYGDGNVTGRAAPYVLIGTNGADGSMLSTAAQTKEVSAQIGTIATAAGTTTLTIRVPSTVAAGSKLTGISFVTKDALAASDTNYVKWGLVNKGAAGAGTQVLVDDTAAANSTKATGGTALSAYTPRALTMATLTVGTERDVTGGDVLLLTITVTGTLANTLRESSVLLEFSFQN